MTGRDDEMAAAGVLAELNIITESPQQQQLGEAVAAYIREREALKQRTAEETS